MSHRISQATEDDIQQLTALVNSAYRGESSRKGWTTEADFLDGVRTDEAALKDIIQRPGAFILKCVNDREEIIACVHLEKENHRLYLGMLTVKPELQNKGIGKMMLHAAEAEAMKLRCQSIYMTVLSERAELIAWYERHGYANTHQAKPFPMDNPRFGLPKKFLEFVVMKKLVKG